MLAGFGQPYIVVMGTHTGAPFSPMPGKLPAIDKTDICVKIGPETFTLWVDADGKVCKTEITPLGAGHPHGRPASTNRWQDPRAA